MQVEKKVSVGQFCWLRASIYGLGGGIIEDLYLPESKEELIECVNELNKSDKQFFIFGHTSNCYFLPSFNAETVISTRLLNHYAVLGDRVICEPGAHIKTVAKDLTNQGFIGYSGLVDLPGTVAAAVYGNAGCFGCETKDIVQSVEILLPNGTIRTLKNEDLGFKKRSSALKRNEIQGVILLVSLKKENGDRKTLLAHSEACHRERQQTQPGPANNLGSCFMSGTKTLGLRIVERIVYHIGNLLKFDKRQRLKLLLKIYGERKLVPYLFELNRFMWTDKQSHEVFNQYVAFYRKIYKNAQLEIQLFE